MHAGRVLFPAEPCELTRSIALEQIDTAHLVLGSRTFPVERAQLTELVQYQRARHATLRYANQSYAVIPALRPTLQLASNVMCPAGAENRHGCIDGKWSVALEHVHRNENSLVVGAHDCVRDEFIAGSEIELASLTFKGEVPERPRPKFGAGFTVLGPATFFSITAQYSPLDRFTLELGLLPWAPLLGAWVGARATPLRVGPLSLYVGGFANALMAHGGGMTSVGARAGLELLFPSKRDALLVEYNLPRCSPDCVSMQGNGVHWGGATFVHLL